VSLGDFLRRLSHLPVAGVLATDVGREGRLAGIDPDAVTQTLGGTPLPVWIAGGVTTEQDLEMLEAEGAAGAVLGMALYTDTIDAETVARRWGGRTLGRTT